MASAKLKECIMQLNEIKFLIMINYVNHD